MITVVIEPDDWLTKARQETRRLVIEAGLSDDDNRPANQAGPKGSRAACWMRLVVHTNVFVSAILEENFLPFLVPRWIDRHDGLLKSAATEQQLLDVLRRPCIEAATIPSLREGLARMLTA